jgi:hypothetical protein
MCAAGGQIHSGMEPVGHRARSYEPIGDDLLNQLDELDGCLSPKPLSTGWKILALIDQQLANAGLQLTALPPN